MAVADLDYGCGAAPTKTRKAPVVPPWSVLSLGALSSTSTGSLQELSATPAVPNVVMTGNEHLRSARDTADAFGGMLRLLRLPHGDARLRAQVLRRTREARVFDNEWRP